MSKQIVLLAFMLWQFWQACNANISKMFDKKVVALGKSVSRA